MPRSDETRRIDIERPAHAAPGQRFDCFAPVGQESLQSAAPGALHQDLAALQSGAAREPCRHWRIDLDVELMGANHGERRVARRCQKCVNVSALRRVGGEEREIAERRQSGYSPLGEQRSAKPS